MRHTMNAGKVWTRTESKTIRILAKRRTPTKLIASRLGRTQLATQRKARQLGISLKLVTRSSNGRKRH